MDVTRKDRRMNVLAVINMHRWGKLSLQMIPSNLQMTFLSLHLLRHVFVAWMNWRISLSGDIWRKNERDVKQTSCKVVCFNAVRVAPTVFTGYMCVCVCISWNWKRVLVWICLSWWKVWIMEMAPYFVKTSIPDVFLPQKTTWNHCDISLTL